jgi:hypothetical protein
MDTLLTTSNIMFAIGIIGIIFSIYQGFHKPQEELETNQALSKKDIDNKATILAQKEMENKASLLEQQVKLAYEANEKKFQEMGARIDSVVAKVDTLVLSSSTWHLDISNKMVELTTIIAERIPRVMYQDNPNH